MTTYTDQMDVRVLRSCVRLGRLLDMPNSPDVVIANEAAMLFDRLAMRYGAVIWDALGRAHIARQRQLNGWCPFHKDVGDVAQIVPGGVCCAACVEEDRANEEEL